MKLNEVRYYYYGRTREVPNDRVITVASQLSINPLTGDLVLHLGISFLGEGDRFVRAKGRRIAYNRLVTVDTAFFIPFTGNSNKDIINYLESIRALMPKRYRDMVFDCEIKNHSTIKNAHEKIIKKDYTTFLKKGLDFNKKYILY